MAGCAAVKLLPGQAVSTDFDLVTCFVARVGIKTHRAVSAVFHEHNDIPAIFLAQHFFTVVTCYTTTDSACNRCHRFALTLADLVADQASDYCPGDCA